MKRPKPLVKKPKLLVKKPKPLVKASKARQKTVKVGGTSQMSAEHRRALFVEAYLSNGGNGKVAAINAGYSRKGAEVVGSKMIRHPEVAALLRERLGKVLSKYELTTERTLREVARLSYADIRKLYREDGTLKLPHELDDDSAAAVSGFDVDELMGGEGKSIGCSKKVRLHDKNAALEKAMKYHGLYERDNDQLGNAVARIFIVPGKQVGSG